MKKKFKWAIAIFLTVCIIVYSIYSANKPLDVELLEVQPQTVSQTFKEEGIVASATERPIYSVFNGEIKALRVKEGQQVKKGDILIELDSKALEYQKQQLKGQLESIKGQQIQANKSPYSAQVRQQQLVVEETKRQLETSKIEYNRIKSLFESGAASKKELDASSDSVKQLENTLLQQQQALKLIEEQANPLPGTAQYYQGLIESVNAQIKELDYQLSNTKITAPIDGIVKELSVKVGAMATTLSPLLTLTSHNDFEVNVYLLTEDVINVKEGMNVKLVQKRKNGDYTFDGTVKGIAPAAEEKISALGLIEQKVKVSITPDGQAPELRSGYALDVHFTTLVQHNKLVVPKTVLFPYENGDALWVKKDGKAVITKVQKGMETDELIVIESGLKAGEKVIKNPQQEGLKQGKRIS